MNPQDEYILFVCALSGAQAKVILAFLGTRGGMTIDELKQRSGVKDRNTLYDVCESLALPPYRALAKQTMAHGKTVWLPAGSLLPALRTGYFQNPDAGKSITWDADLIINNNSTQNLKTESLLLGPDDGEKPASGKALPAPQANPAFDACRQAARKCGIGDPSASVVADLRSPEGEWITPELITAHCKALARPKETLGMAIHRMKDWQPVPGRPAEPGSVDERVAAFLGKRTEAGDDND